MYKNKFLKKAIDNKLKENVSQHTIINLYENETITFQNQPKNPFMNRAQFSKKWHMSNKKQGKSNS